MKIKHIEIENFRGIEHLQFSPDKDANVIVGPNAMGKTTILEGIRLLKALLAPRYFQEAQQTLQQLGALSQNFQFMGQNQLDYSSLARDPTKSLKVAIDFIVSPEEQELLDDNVPNLALSFVRGQIGRNDEQATFALTQFLSSQKGHEALSSASLEAKSYFDQVKKAAGTLSLRLTFNPETQSYSGSDPYAHLAISFLDQRLPLRASLLSYFAADRAFPAGEVNIQIGSADAANQVQSHIGQPALKYARLKQTIVQGIITNQIDPGWVQQEFKIILENLIPGKALSAIEINQLGQIKVMIQDRATGKKFDIDSMSSGEKGVILTFLLIRQSLGKGGILLIDEPELHLNPAVCKKILPFLIDWCIKPYNLQAFICTHSPEILGDAFDRDDSNLYHLRSPTDLTKVLKRDQNEVFEAMRRLGSSAADVLFSKGNIFVEGEHDSEILNDGFFDLISGYKISDLGGRQEVEKEIDNLQKAEENGKLQKPSLFIFDLDNAPTYKKSKKLVRVTQWNRFCFENYLIDETILFDLISELAKKKPDSRGSFSTRLKCLAMQQTEAIAIREIYKKLEPENPGLRPREIANKTLDEVSDILLDRLKAIAEKTSKIDDKNWKDRFTNDTKERSGQIASEWQNTWQVKSNGKTLISSLYREYEIQLDQLAFKKRIIQRMRHDKTEVWRSIDGLLRKELDETQK